MMEEKQTNSDVDALDELLGITDEGVAQIKQALEDEKFRAIKKTVESLHPADMAYLYEQLSAPLRQALLDNLDDDLDGEFLWQLDEVLRADIIETMRAKPLAKVLANLESDDAVALLEDLNEDKQHSVLSFVPRADRDLYKEVLSYPQNTAARSMRRELVSVPDIWTIGHIIDYLRTDKDLPDDFSSIIVLGRAHKPLGVLPLSDLLKKQRNIVVKKILKEDNFYAIPANMEQEKIAYLFKQYDLLEAPVIDEDGRLIGVITVDDIVDIIEEEAEDDILKMAGLIEGDFYNDVLDTAKLRFPWLMINLLTAMLASVVIGFYADTLEQVVALAILMPIVASMGGNAGTQTLTIAVRALSNNDLTSANAVRIIGKEALVGLINGVLFAFITGIAVWLWFDNGAVGVTIGIALIINLLAAGLAGILIPVGLDKIGIDPAISGAVIISTITDIIGFVVFLGLATMVIL